MDKWYIWAILIPIIIVFILIVVVAVKIAIKQVRRKRLTKQSLDEDSGELKNKVLDAFGNRDNIEKITHEMSRLTVRVKDLTKANLEELKALGATGILVMGNDIKCAFGEQAERIYNLIK